MCIRDSFIGVAAIVISGVMLKKTKLFSGDPAPFVMELPTYHVPSANNVLRATWAVSYTHLDVYKRQRPRCSASCRASAP